MKNAEYFLKDNVSVEEFASKFIDFCFDNRAKRGTTSYMEDIKDFLNEEYEIDDLLKEGEE